MINSDENLKQSVILVANHFEQIRFSIVNERIDVELLKASLGPVIEDILRRFKPFFEGHGTQYKEDVEQLERLIK